MEDTTSAPKRKTRVPADMSQKLAWLKRVLADPGLSASAKNVATALFMHHQKETGRCDPQQATLAKAVSLNRQSVNRLVGELEAGGWITAYRTRGASAYVLNVGHGSAKVELDDGEMSAVNDNSEEASGESRCPIPRTSDVLSGGHQMSYGLDTEQSSLNRPIEKSVSPQTPSPPAPVPGGPGTKIGASGRKDRKERKPRAPRQAGGGTPLPAGFELTDSRKRMMTAAGVRMDDMRDIFDHFTAHALDTGRTSHQWDAALEVWCRNNVSRRRKDEAVQAPKKSRHQF